LENVNTSSQVDKELAEGLGVGVGSGVGESLGSAEAAGLASATAGPANPNTTANMSTAADKHKPLRTVTLDTRAVTIGWYQ
jgi:hypothetical protein